MWTTFNVLGSDFPVSNSRSACVSNFKSDEASGSRMGRTRKLTIFCLRLFTKFEKIKNRFENNDLKVTYPLSGSSSTWFLLVFEFGNVGFCREGQTRVPGEKALEAKERTNI